MSQNQTQALIAAVAKYQASCAAARHAYHIAIEKSHVEYLNDCARATEAPPDSSWPDTPKSVSDYAYEARSAIADRDRAARAHEARLRAIPDRDPS